MAAERLPQGVPAAGTRFGDYELLDVLGVGGMGCVYLARHVKLRRRVALKLLLPEQAKHADMARRFVNEARAVNRIEHPNLVDVLDIVEDDGGHSYFIMELLEGRDLGQARKEDGPFTVARVLAIARQIASALAAAHRAGIVHRDLKPSNVFLVEHAGERDFVKLLDFGIAKVPVTAETPQTGLGLILGTPGYMAPEQAVGLPVDRRADVYSFGVLLHLMLTDELPLYSGISSAEGVPPGLTLPTPGGEPVPQGLAWLVGRCLRFKPEDRMQSMDAVVAELGQFAAPVRDLSSAPTQPAAAGEGKTQPPADHADGEASISTRIRPQNEAARGAAQRSSTRGPSATEIAMRAALPSRRGPLAGGILLLAAVALASAWWWSRPAAPPLPGTRAALSVPAPRPTAPHEVARPMPAPQATPVTAVTAVTPPEPARASAPARRLRTKPAVHRGAVAPDPDSLYLDPVNGQE